MVIFQMKYFFKPLCTRTLLVSAARVQPVSDLSVCKSHSSRVQSIRCTKTSLTAWWPFCLLSHGEPLRKHTSRSDWCQHTVMFGFLGMHDILVTIWRYWPILTWFKLLAYQQLSWTKYVIHQQHWRNVTYIICRKCEIIISVKLYI